jgi:trigger factor
MREQRAPWTPVANEKPKPKDLVDITIASRENGEVKDPQPYQFVLGEGRAIPDVEERIMALVPGESVDATVRFPDDFPEEAKRGQTRDVQLTLREVKRQELPALDDAFAREMGDFESLDALRTAVTSDLGKEAEREADAKVRTDLIQQIIEANNVVAPRPLVERVLSMYAQAYEVPQDRWQQFAQEFHSIAESQVRRDLVLDHVVESQNLRATEAELDQKVQELAERRGMPAAQLYASLEKAKRLRDVARSITEEKVFAYLLSQSTVETA